jgi:hypothetical protein
MELSPSSEAANYATTQELPSILWNPKVHYRVRKSPLLVPIVSQIDPVHTILSYLFKIHFNIVPHLRLGLPSGLLPSGFPANVLYAFDWLRAGRPRGRNSSPDRVKNFLHSVQTGSGVHPTSYPMSTGGSFPGGRAAMA